MGSKRKKHVDSNEPLPMPAADQVRPELPRPLPDLTTPEEPEYPEEELPDERPEDEPAEELSGPADEPPPAAPPALPDAELIRLGECLFAVLDAALARHLINARHHATVRNGLLAIVAKLKEVEHG